MKKRIITMALIVLMTATFFAPAANADCAPAKNAVTVTDLGNGITVESTTFIEEAFSPLSLMATKKATKQDVYKCNGSQIAIISITANFGYDGSSSWVNSASVSKDISSGWTYSNEDITTSGGTATVTATLKKFPYNVAVDTYISCSPDGEIS